MKKAGHKKQFYPLLQKSPDKNAGGKCKIKEVPIESQNNRQYVDTVRNTMFSAPFQANWDAKAGIQIYH